jgi:hypothetical protein
VPEWDALGWDVQRMYLEGMGDDESVPLSFGRREAGEGMPEEMRWAEREAQGASVIDITAMISGLEASRGAGR